MNFHFFVLPKSMYFNLFLKYCPSDPGMEAVSPFHACGRAPQGYHILILQKTLVQERKKPAISFFAHHSSERTCTQALLLSVFSCQPSSRKVG